MRHNARKLKKQSRAESKAGKLGHSATLVARSEIELPAAPVPIFAPDFSSASPALVAAPRSTSVAFSTPAPATLATPDPTTFKTPVTTPAPRPASIVRPTPRFGLFRGHRATPSLVDSFEALLEAVSSRRPQITLGSDIILPRTVIIDHDVALDLGGHSIIAGQGLTSPLFDLHQGDVTITGEGKIFAMRDEAIIFRVFGAIGVNRERFTSLLIDEHAHLFSPNGTAILITPSLGVAYGVSVKFKGEIIASTGIHLAESVRGTERNLPEITLSSGSRIIADENNGTAVDASGIGIWHLGATRLYGKIGITVGGGKLDLENTQIIASSSAITSIAEGSPATIKIDGGNYLSENGITFSGTPDIFHDFTAETGNFCGAAGVINQELSDTVRFFGGEFSTNVAETLESPDFMVAFPDFEPESFDLEDEQEMVLVKDESEDLEDALETVAEAPLAEPAPEKPKEPTPITSDTLILPGLAAPISTAPAQPVPEAPKAPTFTLEPSASDPEPVPEPKAPKMITLEHNFLTRALASTSSTDILLAGIPEDETEFLADLGTISKDVKSTRAEKTAPKTPSEKIVKVSLDLEPSLAELADRIAEDLELSASRADAEVDFLEKKLDDPKLDKFIADKTDEEIVDLILDSEFGTYEDYDFDYSDDTKKSSKNASKSQKGASESQKDTPKSKKAPKVSEIIEKATPKEATKPVDYGKAYLIDESAPSTHWSTGAASIDESTPDRYAGRKLSRAMRNRLAGSPVASLAHSVRMGIKIGIDGVKNAK